MSAPEHDHTCFLAGLAPMLLTGVPCLVSVLFVGVGLI